MRWSLALLGALAVVACDRSEERGVADEAPGIEVQQGIEQQPVGARTGAGEPGGTGEPAAVPGTGAFEEGAAQQAAFPAEAYGTGPEGQGEGIGAGVGGPGASRYLQGDNPGEDVKSGEPAGGALGPEDPGATTPQEAQRILHEGWLEPTGNTDLGP